MIGVYREKDIISERNLMCCACKEKWGGGICMYHPSPDLCLFPRMFGNNSIFFLLYALRRGVYLIKVLPKLVEFFLVFTVLR